MYCYPHIDVFYLMSYKIYNNICNWIKNVYDFVLCVGKCVKYIVVVIKPIYIIHQHKQHKFNDYFDIPIKFYVLEVVSVLIKKLVWV